MDAQKIRSLGRFGGAHVELLIEARGADQVDDAPLRRRRIGAVASRWRFHPAADGNEQGLDAGAMPEGALIGVVVGLAHGLALAPA